jgi:hypothetical protein
MRTAGCINVSRRFPEEWTVDIALGLRLLHSDKWLTADDLRAANEQQTNDGLYELKIDGSRVAHVLRFDPKNRFALVYYKYNVPGTGFEEIENSDWTYVKDVCLPRHIVRHSTVTFPDGVVRTPFTFTVMVAAFRLNDTADAPDKLMVMWPANIDVLDTRTNQHLATGPTTRVLTEDDIRETNP